MAVATSGRPAGYRDQIARLAGMGGRILLGNLANALTASRIVCAVPLALLVLDAREVAAFWIFLAAALTDVADGFVAKRWTAPSEVGAALDPIADKLLLGCLFLALVDRGLLPLWLVVLAIGRDVMLVVGAVVLRSRLQQFRIEPLVIGKLSTFLQLLLVGFVLGQQAGIAAVEAVIGGLVAAVAVVTVVSAAAYVLAGLRLQAQASSPA